MGCVNFHKAESEVEDIIHWPESFSGTTEIDPAKLQDTFSFLVKLEDDF